MGTWAVACVPHCFGSGLQQAKAPFAVHAQQADEHVRRVQRFIDEDVMFRR